MDSALHVAPLARLAAALVCLLCLATAGAAERPNLLLILTDNQSPELLGAYGNREIRTPNIDRLAAEGMLFTRAFATSALRVPSNAVRTLRDVGYGHRDELLRLRVERAGFEDGSAEVLEPAVDLRREVPTLPCRLSTWHRVQMRLILHGASSFDADRMYGSSDRAIWKRA